MKCWAKCLNHYLFYFWHIGMNTSHTPSDRMWRTTLCSSTGVWDFTCWKLLIKDQPIIVFRQQSWVYTVVRFSLTRALTGAECKLECTRKTHDGKNRAVETKEVFTHSLSKAMATKSLHVFALTLNLYSQVGLLIHSTASMFSENAKHMFRRCILISLEYALLRISFKYCLAADQLFVRSAC